MQKIIIATKNKGKTKEFQSMLTDLKISSINLLELAGVAEPIETGSSFIDNAILKATYYANIYNANCLADDSGLVVESLNGEPGIYSARYAGEHSNDLANNNLLLKNLQGVTNRKCKFVCALALVSPNGKILAQATGECFGQILHAPIGTEGFGYDPLFYSEEIKKTLAQASMQEKNSISHRAKALSILKNKLLSFS